MLQRRPTCRTNKMLKKIRFTYEEKSRRPSLFCISRTKFPIAQHANSRIHFRIPPPTPQLPCIVCERVYACCTGGESIYTYMANLSAKISRRRCRRRLYSTASPLRRVVCYRQLSPHRDSKLKVEHFLNYKTVHENPFQS